MLSAFGRSNEREGGGGGGGGGLLSAFGRSNEREGGGAVRVRPVQRAGGSLYHFHAAGN